MTKHDVVMNQFDTNERSSWVEPSATDGMELFVVALLILGAGVAGIQSASWLQVVYWSLGFGIALNAVLMIRFALLHNRSALLFSTFASIPSGLFDGAKILMIGGALYWSLSSGSTENRAGLIWSVIIPIGLIASVYGANLLARGRQSKNLEVVLALVMLGWCSYSIWAFGFQGVVASCVMAIGCAKGFYEASSLIANRKRKDQALLLLENRPSSRSDFQRQRYK